MNSNNIYEYLGIAVVAILLLLFILKSMKFQANILESMVSSVKTSEKSDLAVEVKNNSTLIEDSLLIDKYRKDYENIIIELEAVVNSNIFNSLSKNAVSISKDPFSDESQKIIVGINNLKAFKDSLNESMTFIDKYKSTK
jgi:hypothetical protein